MKSQVRQILKKARKCMALETKGTTDLLVSEISHNRPCREDFSTLNYVVKFLL